MAAGDGPAGGATMALTRNAENDVWYRGIPLVQQSDGRFWFCIEGTEHVLGGLDSKEIIDSYLLMEADKNAAIQNKFIESNYPGKCR